MSEGGQFPWKVQKVDTSRGPPGKYDHISRREPLPCPPVGTTWVRDEDTREWSLVKCVEAEEEILPKRSSSSSSSLPDNAVEGVDYVVHTVLPSDTFSGLCLRYKISAIHLRRANKFSGTNLRLAPSRLVIPLGGMGGSKAGGRMSKNE